MAKYLGQTGLTALWARIKAHVTSSISDLSTTIGNYTINGKKISTNPTLAKGDVGLANVTNDAQVKRSEMGAASGVATLGADGKLPTAQLPSLKTVNGQSVVGSGNITIDLSVYKVVETLPTADIDVNKIYLVLSAESGTENTYTEYLYVNSKWEKIGEYVAAVDLTNYVKFTDVATTTKAGVMSAADKTKLNGLNNYTLPTASSTVKGGIKTGFTATGKKYPVAMEGENAYVEVPWTNTTYAKASGTADGLMSKEHYTKLEGIAAGATADSEMTAAEVEAICV